jgi:hypothetical protein
MDTTPRWRNTLARKREVELLGRLEALALVVGQHAIGDVRGALRGQDLVDRRFHRSVDAIHGRHARGDMQVGGPLGDHLFEQFPQRHHD